jgi:hypothetical protein
MAVRWVQSVVGEGWAVPVGAVRPRIGRLVEGESRNRPLSAQKPSWSCRDVWENSVRTTFTTV